MTLCTKCAFLAVWTLAVYGNPTPMPVPAPVAAPVPGITPTAAATQTLGWYAAGNVSGQTTYAPWTYDVYSTSYYTSSTYFRRCAVSSTCTMYTDCSQGYLVAASTSSFCGTGGSASSAYYCSHHILKSSIDASIETSWFWCDQPPLTGVTFYEQQPNQPAVSTTIVVTSISNLAGDTTGATTAAVNGTSASTPPPSAAPATSGSSTNTGAIAGGVVGGVVAIAIAATILYLLHGRRKARALSEAKPVGVQEAPYQKTVEAPWPQGPYDPPPQEAAGTEIALGELPGATSPRSPQELPTK